MKDVLIRRGVAMIQGVVAAAVLLSLSLPLQAQQVSLLDEIVVTARKKSENLQSVPVSVSAISGDILDDLQLQDLSDISKITAGLLFDNEFSRQSNRPVIRGQANILGDSGVSYFIDGVYITGSISDYDLNDIERIEVVKGPQSALYGRNTYSGAINIISKSPGDELSGDLRFEFAEDGQFETSAAIRGPIIKDVLSGGINIRKYELDGAFTNSFDGSKIGVQESASASAVLEFTPNDRLKMRARVYYADLDDGQSPLFHQDASENNCFFDNGALYGGGGRYFCGELSPRAVNSDWTVQAPNARLESEQLQTSLSIDFDISDRATLTSVTGYNKSNTIDISEADYQPTSFQTAVFTPGGFPFAGFPVPPFSYGYVGSVVDFTFAGDERLEDFSQEIRYSFESDNFEFLLGGYYFKQEDDDMDVRSLPAAAPGIAVGNYFAALAEQQALCAANPICGSISPFFGPGIAVPRDINNFEIENKALFALVGIGLSDTLNLTLEGRYQEEDITQTAIIRDLGGPVTGTVNSFASFDSFSPRVTLDWQFNDNSMLYVLYAEGTKPGGFNGTVAIEAGLPTFEEEEVSSIEIGSKNVWLDGQMTANFSLFFNSIDGYQLTQNARAGANTTSATVNAGDADINGLEAELLIRPAAIEGLTITANYAFTDAEFSSGRDQNQGLLNDVLDDGSVNCSLGDEFLDDTTCTSAFGSIVGKKVPRTAEHQAFVDVEMRRGFNNGSDWEWFVGSNLSYESSKFAQVHSLLESGTTTLMSARFGVSNERFSLNFWGKNLLGEDSSPLVLRYADGADSFKRSFVGTLRRDTYYGFNASARF